MKLALPAAVLVLVGTTAWADPPPQQPAAPTVPAAPPPTRIRIETTNEGSQTRLLIPRNLLANVQHALREQGSKTPTALSLPSSAVVLALGVAPSLAGFCLVRKPRPLVRGILVVLVLALLVPGAINVAQAVGVGRSASHSAYHPDFQLNGPIVVEVTDTGDTIRLVLARKTPLRQRSK